MGLDYSTPTRHIEGVNDTSNNLVKEKGLGMIIEHFLELVFIGTHWPKNRHFLSVFPFFHPVVVEKISMNQREFVEFIRVNLF